MDQVFALYLIRRRCLVVLVVLQELEVSQGRLPLLIGNKGVLFLVVGLVILLEEGAENKTVNDAVFVALGSNELGVAGPDAEAQLDLVVDVHRCRRALLKANGSALIASNRVPDFGSHSGLLSLAVLYQGADQILLSANALRSLVLQCSSSL